MTDLSCRLRNRDVRYQVGTSGYVVGKKKWQKMPCLNCLELNSTFYHLPSKQLTKSLMNLPPNVSLIVKASQQITHYSRLKNVKQLWLTLWNRIKDIPNLKCVLFQMPPTFTMNEENMNRIRILKTYVPASVDIAVEFRNNSWLVAETYEMLKELNWCIVGTLIVKRPSTRWVGNMPPGLFMPPRTSNYNYVRVHGKKKWRGLLSSSELSSLHDAVADQVVQTSYVIFNNSFFDKRGDSCTVRKTKLPSASVCNAIDFTSKITKKRRGRRLKVRTARKIEEKTQDITSVNAS